LEVEISVETLVQSVVEKNGITNTHVPIAGITNIAGSEVTIVVVAREVVTSLVEDLGTDEIAPLERIDVLLLTSDIVVVNNIRSEAVVVAQPVQKTDILGYR